MRAVGAANSERHPAAELEDAGTTRAGDSAEIDLVDAQLGRDGRGAPARHHRSHRTNDLGKANSVANCRRYGRSSTGASVPIRARLMTVVVAKIDFLDDTIEDLTAAI